MAKNGYTTLNLPTALVDELRIWHIAFCNAYGKSVSYADIIRGMLDSLEDSDPSVVQELEILLKKHPELKEKMANYHNVSGKESKEKNEQ